MGKAFGLDAYDTSESLCQLSSEIKVLCPYYYFVSYVVILTSKSSDLSEHTSYVNLDFVRDDMIIITYRVIAAKRS